MAVKGPSHVMQQALACVLDRLPEGAGQGEEQLRALALLTHAASLPAVALARDDRHGGVAGS